MKRLLLGLLLISFSLAVSISVNKGIATIDFDHYPVFNVAVRYIASNNVAENRTYLHVLQKISIQHVKKVLTVTYDNSTWIKLERKTLDNETGKLELSGKTEDARICTEGKIKEKDREFWSKPEHCYESITAYINGKKVKSVFADEKGNWEMEIQLSPGENRITLEARDPGGNLAKEETKVNWRPTSKSLVMYYLSRPEIQVLIAVAGLVALLALALFIRAERIRKKRMEEIQKALSQAFEDLRIEISKYHGDIIQAIQSPEVNAKMRRILMTDPFYGYIKKNIEEYKKAKASKSLEEWKTKFLKGLHELLVKHDPNARLFAQDYHLLESAYDNVSLKLVKELAERKTI